MYQAIGKNTKKVYAEAASRAEVMQKLIADYPMFKVEKDRNRLVDPLYPEPLMIGRGLYV